MTSLLNDDLLRYALPLGSSLSLMPISDYKELECFAPLLPKISDNKIENRSFSVYSMKRLVSYSEIYLPQSDMHLLPDLSSIAVSALIKVQNSVRKQVHFVVLKCSNCRFPLSRGIESLTSERSYTLTWMYSRMTFFDNRTGCVHVGLSWETDHYLWVSWRMQNLMRNKPKKKKEFARYLWHRGKWSISSWIWIYFYGYIE